MRLFKLVSGLTMILALTAIAAATASAATPGFLPAKVGGQFTGKSGKAALQIAPFEGKAQASITCKASEIKAKEGEFTNAELMTFLFKVTFTGCESVGLAVNSVGDAAKTILAHVEGEACTISNTPLVVGLLLKVLPFVIEVPTTKLTLAVEGSFVSLVTPENKPTKEFQLIITQKGGVQTQPGCLNAALTAIVPETLTTSVDGSKALQSGQESEKGTLTFAEEVEWMT